MYICLPCAVCCERDAVPPAENGLPNPGKTKGRKIKNRFRKFLNLFCLVTRTRIELVLQP